MFEGSQRVKSDYREGGDLMGWDHLGHRMVAWSRMEEGSSG